MTHAALQPLTPEQLEPVVRQALKQWHQPASGASPFAQLSLFHQAQRLHPGAAHELTNHILHTALNLLAVTANQQAKLLRDRYLDVQTVYNLANQLNVAESTLYTLQRDAITNLTKVIHTAELQCRAEQEALLATRLNAQNHLPLVGVADHLVHLTELLSKPGPPWLIALEGMGGIGKTTLADTLVRQLSYTNTYADIGWVTARQSVFNLGGGLQMVEQPALTAPDLIEQLARQLIPDLFANGSPPASQIFSALQARLKQSFHLIIVDNLESLLDVGSLFPTLDRLANPSRFLITSRESYYAAANLYHFPVPELNQSAALQLIRQAAHLGNLPLLANSSDADLLPIFATVGGNPLALRLVVGQLHIHPLPTILADLAQARSQSSRNLFSYIYQRAWANLDESTRQALVSMPLLPAAGDTLDYLAQVSGLALGPLQTALARLVALNLVNSIGDMNQRRYTIHNLTRTWLLQEIAQWT